MDARWRREDPSFRAFGSNVVATINNIGEQPSVETGRHGSVRAARAVAFRRRMPAEPRRGDGRRCRSGSPPPKPGRSRRSKRSMSGIAALQQPFNVLKGTLSDRNYLLGDAFSVPDLNVASVVCLGARREHRLREATVSRRLAWSLSEPRSRSAGTKVMRAASIVLCCTRIRQRARGLSRKSASRHHPASHRP